MSLLAISAFILLANPSVPAKSVQELIALAKATPGKLDYASSGAGSSLHMAMELFRSATSTDMLHVPYKGATTIMTDVTKLPGVSEAFAAQGLEPASGTPDEFSKPIKSEPRNTRGW